MAGTLTVQNIEGPTSGANANKVIIPSGQTLDASAGFIPPSGHVVQTVSSGGFGTTITITSTTFVATGHSVSITTKFDNSYVLLQLAGGGWYDNGNSTQSQWLTFYRSVSGGSYTNLADVNTTYGLQRMSGDGNTWNIKPHSAHWLDATGQTANTSITYQVYTRVNSGSSQYNSSDRGTPVFIAQEIAG